MTKPLDPQLRRLLEQFIDDVQPMLAGSDAIIESLPENPKCAADAFKDHGAFYDYLRKNDMLGPRISQEEYDGCEAIVLAFAQVGAPISYVAYALATAFLETGGTMQPISEYGGTSYFRRMYDIRGNRPSKARELGNVKPDDGAKYRGRGYVQLTGRTNYTRATEYLREAGFDVDLVSNPHHAMKPDVAAFVMVRGMTEGALIDGGYQL